MRERNDEPSCAQILGDWYDKYRTDVYNSIKEKVRYAHELAEDLTSETFERAYESLKGRNLPIENPKRWLLKIANNVTVAYWQRQSREADVRHYPRSRISSYDEDEESIIEQVVDTDEEIQPEVAVERRELFNTILRYLGELSMEQRQAVSLRFLEELSFPQISAQTHRAQSTVEKDVRTGLDKLRVRLIYVRE